MGGNFDIFNELQITCGYEYPNQYEYFVMWYPEEVIMDTNSTLVAGHLSIFSSTMFSHQNFTLYGMYNADIQLYLYIILHL